MQKKRIIITYTCNHAGPHLEPVTVKFWDSCPPPGAVCFCLADGEKAGERKATPMIFKIDVEEIKPE